MNKKTKYVPLSDKEYVVTDSCFWKQMTKEEMGTYNPYAKDRMPHSIECVDVATGTVVHLASGSVIKVISSPK